ncbi:hypothetical protein [Sphingosinithalassobacter portus]|uniref:hypothetical protein n=1 Tax=Stakelama portus TaxID=2676234 RepID=UPI0011AB4FDB|nr:hypothetical protein [Sphingosinithalassobacter portus]
MRKWMAPMIAAMLLAGCNANDGGNVATGDSDNRIAMAADANVSAADGEAVSGAQIQLAPDGIGYVYPDGRIGRAAFGTGKNISSQMAVAALGDPIGDTVNSECGAGPLEIVDYQGNFSMLYQDGRFVGWTLGGDDSLLTTASGIGIGSTRSEMADTLVVTMVPESTLGSEFMIGDSQMGGLLNGNDADAIVTDLWAGTTCMFR